MAVAIKRRDEVPQFSGPVIEGQVVQTVADCVRTDVKRGIQLGAHAAGGMPRHLQAASGETDQQHKSDHDNQPQTERHGRLPVPVCFPSLLQARQKFREAFSPNSGTFAIAIADPDLPNARQET